MKKYLKHIVIATLFVVCALTTIWAINYDKSTTPLNNETTQGISGNINFSFSTMKLVDEGNPSITTGTSSVVNYGDTIQVIAPVESGHIFMYWLDGAKNKILSYQSTYNYRVLSLNPNLIAVYLPSTSARVVFLDENNNEMAVQSPDGKINPVTVSVPSSNLIPKRPGYVVTGWMQGSSTLINESGVLQGVTLNQDGIAYVKPIFTRDYTEIGQMQQFTVTVGTSDTFYYFDDVATVTTEATNEGESFAFWTVNGNKVSNELSYSFTVHNDVTLVPVYNNDYTKEAISYIDSHYFTYDFGYNKQITIVGRYELPTAFELVDTGAIFYNGALGMEDSFDLDSPNVVKISSSRQNTKNEFSITYLNGTVFEDLHITSYLVYSDGSALFTTYGDKITINKKTQTNYYLSFDNETKGSYAIGNITINGNLWELDESLIATDPNRVGTKSLRLYHERTSGTSVPVVSQPASITSKFMIMNGISRVNLHYARYGTDIAGSFKIQVASTLDGDQWIDVHTVLVNTTSLVFGSFLINYSGDAYLRIITESGVRINLDEIEINPAPDTTAPVISGASNKTIYVGQTYDKMSGITATDNIDGNLTSSIDAVIKNSLGEEITSINTFMPGTYTVTYTSKDSSNNETIEVITVTVILDDVDPVIQGAYDRTAANADPVFIDESFSAATGVTASDNIDGDLTSSIHITIRNSSLSIVYSVDTSIEGLYYITYSVTDSSGNNHTVVRTIEIIELASSEQLMSPTNLSINTSNDTLTWDPVANAVSYTIYMGDKTFTNATSPFNLNQSSILLTSNYEVAVKAIGNGTSYLDSETSSKITFTRTIKDLFISEYIEGSSNNKYIEIYNGTNSTINLSDYRLVLYANGSTTATNTHQLDGMLASGSVFVYKNTSATIYTGAATTSSTTNFNGDDAIVLFKISENKAIDVFGFVGYDPGSAWTVNGITTVDKTLVRMSNVYYGVTNNTQAFETLGTQWIQYNIDTISNLGSHTVTSLATILIPE